MQVAGLVSRVEDARLGIKVDAADRKKYRLLPRDRPPVSPHNLLALVEENLPAQQRVLVGTGHYSVKVQVAFRVCGH